MNRETIYRQDVLDLAKKGVLISNGNYESVCKAINEIPPVNPQPKTGHCKDCKYFEYDSVAKVDGIPLIVAHEICKRWGDGCKTKEDGYCFMFEPQERSGEK